MLGVKIKKYRQSMFAIFIVSVIFPVLLPILISAQSTRVAEVTIQNTQFETNEDMLMPDTGGIK